MLQQIELWGFLAGLGLFLLGMFMLEQGLRGLGSRSMKKFLREQTHTPLRGVITGAAVTGFLHSSSLVGLIVLAFVGAGIIELRNALGIILGSNLGSTFAGWLVTIIGFKLDLVRYSQPLLALGALGTVFLAQDSRSYFYSNLLLGMGLLLTGIGEMTGAFNTLAENIDVTVLQGRNLFVYFIGGALFTAVVQTSSITIMILLSALSSGVISISEAAPVAIGADLGTTSTVLLGALKGTEEKRRVALSHFFFNLVTDLLALLMLPVLLYFIAEIIALDDPLYSLVVFHSLFNIIGIAIFIPMVSQFIKFLEWLVPKGAREAKDYCVFIRRVPAKVTEAATEAVRKELFNLILQSVRLNLHCFKLHRRDVYPVELPVGNDHHLVYEDDYALLKRAEGEVLGYTYSVQSGVIDEKDVRELTHLNHAIRNTAYAAKFIKDIRHNLMEFRHSSTEAVNSSYNNFLNRIKYIYRKLVELVLNKNPELAVEHYLELKRELRAGYERAIQDIYSGSGVDRIDDEETSSLLNANRAIYLSTSALLESSRVLLSIEENPVMPATPMITDN